jgi:hypothetical protein
VLTTSNVSPTTFGKLFSLPVDGLIYAQPLFVSQYLINGAVHNALVVASMNNSVYAFDADTGGNPLWHVNLGPIVPSSVIHTQNIQVGVGILSTPVIDRVNGLIYLTCKTYDAASKLQTQSLHVLELGTGKDMKGSPVVITATVQGTTDAGPTTITYDPYYQAQRPALLLLNGSVYLAFASHEDHMPFHGWILRYQYDAAAGTLAQTGVFNTTPDGTSGGIWQGGQGMLSDGTSIYTMVANGSVTVPFGGQSYGESFLKLAPDLSVQDWFIPDGWEPANMADDDLGSGGPVLIPGTRLLAGGGKLGTIFVVDSANMGHYNAMDDNNVQEWMGTNSIYGSPVIWAGTTGQPQLYLWGSEDVLKGWRLSNGRFDTTPFAQTTIKTPAGLCDPVGALAVSSNGSKPGTGIVWASMPTANPDHATVPGVFYALDAETLAVLWNSGPAGSANDFGAYAKFVPPTVTNGKVYLATHSQKVVVYGLLGVGSTDH